MNHYIHGIVTVLCLVNPTICFSMFLNQQAGQTRQGRVKAALSTTLAVFMILALSAFFGIKVLHSFGISLSAFSVAGGMVLAWMGFSMLSKSPNKPDSQDAKASHSSASLGPLILFAASPGTITGVITLSVFHTWAGVPLVALVAVTVACLVMMAFLLAAAWSGSSAGGGGPIRDTVSRLMGLIVLAMGIQFGLTGLKHFFS